MSEVSEPKPGEATTSSVWIPAAETRPSSVYPSECGCSQPGRKVYALGQLGIDLVSEARADSVAQSVAATLKEPIPQRSFAYDHRTLLTHLDQNPWDSTAVQWTLNLDGSVIYVIQPDGPYAAETYKRLAGFLKDQLDEGVERISLPGTISGSARLMSGQSVPILTPEIRGMYSWNTSALVKATVGEPPSKSAPQAEKDAHEQTKTGVRNFLDRIYYGHRNLGVLPQDRALNFAATNAFNFEKIYESALKEQMELESIQVTASPYCRPGSDCWDVEVYFFYPDRPIMHVRKVYRFTVDVSDTMPVTVGPTRAWFTR